MRRATREVAADRAERIRRAKAVDPDLSYTDLAERFDCTRTTVVRALAGRYQQAPKLETVE